ncbi:hypothetical protein Peur_018612 [Populus x canadensis]
MCSELAENPVLTPSAHRMCRECLLSSWRMPTTGLCPICRTFLKKTDLITCPTENKFRVDFGKNWEESSKVSKLLECLEHIRSFNVGSLKVISSGFAKDEYLRFIISTSWHGGETPARSSSKEVTHDFRRPHHQGSPVSKDRKAGNAVLPWKFFSLQLMKIGIHAPEGLACTCREAPF